MSEVILLTGAPGSGKTTTLKKILSQITMKVGGFYTEELREAGARVGFRLVTLDGQEGILAHVQIKGQPRVGKYGVDLAVIEEVAVTSLQRAREEGALIVLDEIGPMEILSTPFCQTVTSLLDDDVNILGTIVKRRTPFTDSVKVHPKVTLLEIQSTNHHLILDQVIELFDISMKPS